MALTTLYEILGVAPKAQASEVRLAYRRLAREYHPDLNPDPKSHERMAAINAAFEVLSDPVRRMEYDQRIGIATSSEPVGDGREVRSPDAVRIRIVERLRAHKTPVYDVGFTPLGRLATCSFDNELYWWEPGWAGVEAKVRLDGGVVSAMAVTGERQAVAAGCTEQQLTVWTVDGGRTRAWRQVPKDWIVTVRPSPDGEWLAVGSVNRTARIVSVCDGSPKAVLEGHTESVTSLAWTGDSRLLATGSADATVKIWDASRGKQVFSFQQVRSAVSALAFSPDSHWLAVAAVDLSVRVFDLRRMVLAKTFYGHERPIEALSFHPQSWLLASASRDGTVGLWNVLYGIGHGRVEASLQPLASLAFDPAGNHLTTAGLDRVVRVWRVARAV
jgi:WD40 repeat protein